MCEPRSCSQAQLGEPWVAEPGGLKGHRPRPTPPTPSCPRPPGPLRQVHLSPSSRQEGCHVPGLGARPGPPCAREGRSKASPARPGPGPGAPGDSGPPASHDTEVVTPPFLREVSDRPRDAWQKHSPGPSLPRAPPLQCHQPLAPRGSQPAKLLVSSRPAHGSAFICPRGGPRSAAMFLNIWDSSRLC